LRDGSGVISLWRAPCWVTLHARRAGALGVEDFGGRVVVLRLDVLGRSPTEFTNWRLGIMDAVEDVCASEAGVASILSVPEIDDGSGSVPDEFGV
jgi:hypothetical protein